MTWVAYGVLAVSLLWASVVDARERIVPNGAVVLGVASWALVSLGGFASTGGLSGLFEGLIGGAALGGFSLVSALALDKITGQMSLGGGDVKLLFVSGLHLGVCLGLAAIFLACVLALVWQAGRCVARWAFRRAHVRASCSAKETSLNTFPFAPFISAATALVLTASLSGAVF